MDTYDLFIIASVFLDRMIVDRYFDIFNGLSCSSTTSESLQQQFIYLGISVSLLDIPGISTLTTDFAMIYMISIRLLTLFNMFW